MWRLVVECGNVNVDTSVSSSMSSSPLCGGCGSSWTRLGLFSLCSWKPSLHTDRHEEERRDSKVIFYVTSCILLAPIVQWSPSPRRTGVRGHSTIHIPYQLMRLELAYLSSLQRHAPGLESALMLKTIYKAQVGGRI